MEKQKIVVIDDEKDVSLLMKKALERTELYTVLTAFNGSEGEKICLQEKPDLVFVDYIMPDETGDKVIETLKTNPETKHIPIVLMTGLGEMCYFEKDEKWRWLPNTKVVQDRPVVPPELKWRTAKEEVAAKWDVTIFLRKPFSKETLLEVAEVVLKAKRETQEGSAPDIPV